MGWERPTARVGSIIKRETTAALFTTSQARWKALEEAGEALWVTAVSSSSEQVLTLVMWRSRRQVNHTCQIPCTLHQEPPTLA